MSPERITTEPSFENMPPELDAQAVVAAAEAEAKKIADAMALLAPGPDDRFSNYIEHPTDAQREAAGFLAGKREESASRAEVHGNTHEAEIQRQVAASYRNIASRS